MKTFTVKDALLYEGEDMYSGIYVLRDGEEVFYVGISQDVTSRLMQHLGFHNGLHPFCSGKEAVGILEKIQDISPAILERYLPNLVGRVIVDNAPASLEWGFDVYSLQDCTPYVKKHIPHAVRYEKVISNGYKRSIAEIAEHALMQELKPYLNASGNKYERNLPDKYVKEDEQDGYNPFAKQLVARFLPDTKE